MPAKCYFTSFMLQNWAVSLDGGKVTWGWWSMIRKKNWKRHSLGVYLQVLAFSWCRSTLVSLHTFLALTVNIWKHAKARLNVDATWSTFVGTRRCRRSRWNQMGPWLCHCSSCAPHNPLCFKSRHLFNPCSWWCQYSLNIQIQMVSNQRRSASFCKYWKQV